MAVEPKPMPNLSEADVARFWSGVDKSPDCWTWTKARTRRGYGRFDFKGQRFSAHRVSYLLARGEIATEKFVLHSCDNPICVNPAHLRLGTHQENVQDMVSRGRSRGASSIERRGEGNPIAKLTENDVRAIRSLAATHGQTELARRFNVTQGTIWKIINRIAWRHV